jgi:hypothetical protein
MDLSPKEMRVIFYALNMYQLYVREENAELDELYKREHSGISEVGKRKVSPSMDENVIIKIKEKIRKAEMLFPCEEF